MPQRSDQHRPLRVGNTAGVDVDLADDPFIIPHSDRGGWAGCLVLRELLQESDGTLAMRWPPEVVPCMIPAPTR